MLTFDRKYEITAVAEIFDRDPSIVYHTFAGISSWTSLWIVSDELDNNDDEEVNTKVFAFVRLEEALELMRDRQSFKYELNLLDIANIRTNQRAFYANIRSVFAENIKSIGDTQECQVQILSSDSSVYMTRAHIRSQGRAIPRVLWTRPAF
jgi:hypothetical protein